MFITGNFDRLAVKGKQADDLVDVIWRQTGIGAEGKRVFLRKTNNSATEIIVVVMRFETALGWCGWNKAFMKIIMSTIPDGVAVRFALDKRYGVNQEVVADFEEDADFCGYISHKF